MSNLKIKLEKSPTRCEICHQSDCFDRVTNSCGRCGQLTGYEPAPVQNNDQYHQIYDFSMFIGAVLGILFGLVIEILQGKSLFRITTLPIIFGTMVIGVLFGAITSEGIRRLH